MSEDVDLVVIGQGPGAESLVMGALDAGVSVVAVDKHLVGGECPYYGCIPSKMMVRAGDALAEAGRVSGLAGEASVVPSWSPVADRIAVQATDHWDDTVAVDRLADAGATVLHGTGRLAGPGRVDVQLPDGSTRSFAARRGIVLNTGTRPSAPPIDGLEDTPYWTNRDAVQVTELPGSLVVVGGGPIGCEMAQAFARFGVRVTIVQSGDRLLPADEPEAGTLLEEVLVSEGLRVMTGARTTAVSYADGAFTLTLDSGEALVADKLLVAAGRTPNLDDLGLDTVGLDPTSRTIDVDDHLRVQGGEAGAGCAMWAIGDITGKGAFTHVAVYQSAIALRDLLGQEGPPASYHALPHVTFTDPEVGGVGLSEQQARDAGLRIRVGLAPLEQSSRGFTHGSGARGLIKVIEDVDRGVLVGGTAMGPGGGEILGFLAVAVHAAVPVASLQTMIYAYPTFHRVIETALGDLSDSP